MTQLLFYRFGASLFIGMLIGLQREAVPDRQHEMFAGVRTFSLIGLGGCLAAFVADYLDEPLAFLGFVLLFGSFIVVAYFVTAWRGDVGLTTEMAALVTLFVGALCYWDQLALAVAIGVVVTALLSFKLELHRLAERVTQTDIVATVKFALITAIILPVLPNAALGSPPFDVLNPYKIWLMVVLISGISFLGYLLMKVVGSDRGIGLTGFLGGLVSSTAVTLSFSQRSHDQEQLVKPFTFAIMLAWAVMFARVLVEVAVVNGRLLAVVWLPIAAAGGIGLAYCAYLYLAPHTKEKSDVTVSNPFELGPAIQFGLLYALILLMARAAQLYFGDSGIYLSSILSGLADVDAITLSMAELSLNNTVSPAVAARAIILAAMSNTVVKGSMVMGMGSMTLRRILLPGWVMILTVGVALAVLL